MRPILMLPLPWLLLLNAVAAEPPMKGLPIIEIQNVPTKPTVFQDAARSSLPIKVAARRSEAEGGAGVVFCQ
jgi:hypothetical protein